MSTKTLTKGTILRISLAMPDEMLAAMKKAPELTEASIEKAAQYWHDRILPKHFDSQAHFRYGYANRTKEYLKQRGTNVDLVSVGAPNDGSLRRDLTGRMALSSIGSKDIKVNLKMWARVLDIIPNIANNDPADKIVIGLRSKKRGGTKLYPNIKKEVKAITDEEREALAQFIMDDFKKALTAKTGQTIGV